MPDPNQNKDAPHNAIFMSLSSTIREEASAFSLERREGRFARRSPRSVVWSARPARLTIGTPTFSARTGVGAKVASSSPNPPWLIPRRRLHSKSLLNQRSVAISEGECEGPLLFFHN